jgi:hypothetical protein
VLANQILDFLDFFFAIFSTSLIFKNGTYEREIQIIVWYGEIVQYFVLDD